MRLSSRLILCYKLFLRKCKSSRCFRSTFSHNWWHGTIDCIFFLVTNSGRRTFFATWSEAHAVIFSIHHFFNYIFGRHFKLLADNRLLAGIFHINSKIVPMASGHLLFYGVFFFSFFFNQRLIIKWSSTKGMKTAPGTQNKISSNMTINNWINQVCMTTINEISVVLLLVDTIRKWTNYGERKKLNKKFNRWIILYS